MKKATILFSLVFSFIANAQTWHEVAVPTEKNLRCIDFPSNTVGYIGGEDSLFLKTTDGGLTWNELELTGITMFGGGTTVQHIQFLSENMGYICVGPYAKVYKTTDGGTSWAEVEVSGDLCFVSGMYFFEEDSAVIGGSGCFSPERMDAVGPTGYNVSDIPFTDDWYGTIVDIDFEGDLGIALSDKKGIFRTSDHGVTWDTVHVGIDPGIPLTSVEIIDENVAYIGYENVGSSWGILKTEDGGLTWEEDPSSATFAYPSFLDVFEANNGDIYTGGEPSFGSGMIMEFNGSTGGFWLYNEVDQIIHGFGCYNDDVTWAVGDSGYAVVNTELSSLNLEEREMNIEIYPNPTSNMVSISLSQDVEKFEVGILDMNGKIIISSTNQKTIDVSFLESGLYIINIQTDNCSISNQLIITK